MSSSRGALYLHGQGESQHQLSYLWFPEHTFFRANVEATAPVQHAVLFRSHWNYVQHQSKHSHFPLLVILTDLLVLAVQSHVGTTRSHPRKRTNIEVFCGPGRRIPNTSHATRLSHYLMWLEYLICYLPLCTLSISQLQECSTAFN
jgi:hypothetical protein